MAVASDLENLFSPHGVPRALSRLVQFEEQIGRIWYAEGFEMNPNAERSGIDTWSTDRGFLDALFPFATANGSGSIYALWNGGGSADPNEWPVIIFGDEGGVWVVARNLLELFALLAFDAEPMVSHRRVFYYRDPNTHEFSEGRERFLDWLHETFEIAPIQDTGMLVSAAQALLQPKFEHWKSAFVAK